MHHPDFKIAEHVPLAADFAQEFGVVLPREPFWNRHFTPSPTGPAALLRGDASVMMDQIELTVRDGDGNHGHHAAILMCQDVAVEHEDPAEVSEARAHLEVAPHGDGIGNAGN